MYTYGYPGPDRSRNLYDSRSTAGGNVLVNNVIPKHLEAVIAKLRETGVQIIEGGESLRIVSSGELKSVSIKTLVYPGFPTDLQQPATSLLTTAKGTGIVTETIFNGRFKHIDELKRMGANIKVEGRAAIIYGVEKLTGAEVVASDLRAGASLVVAALMAEGETEIENIQFIDRGYDKLEQKLLNLGADIRRE